MRSSDSAPARVRRMAITTASRGRSTKIAEIILRFSCARRSRSGWGRRTRRTWADFYAGTSALDAVGDDHLALLQAASDNGGSRRRLTQLDATLLDLVTA